MYKNRRISIDRKINKYTNNGKTPNFDIEAKLSNYWQTIRAMIRSPWPKNRPTVSTHWPLCIAPGSPRRPPASTSKRCSARPSWGSASNFSSAGSSSSSTTIATTTNWIQLRPQGYSLSYCHRCLCLLLCLAGRQLWKSRPGCEGMNYQLQLPVRSRPWSA